MTQENHGILQSFDRAAVVCKGVHGPCFPSGKAWWLALDWSWPQITNHGAAVNLDMIFRPLRMNG